MDNFDWVTEALQNFLEGCIIEVGSNVELWTNGTNITEVTPPSSVLDSICPRECNDRGKCIKGTVHRKY